MRKYQIFGLGGLFEVEAENEDGAVAKARRLGLIALSWVKLVE